MRKVLALAIVGASLALTATAALAGASHDFLPNTPDNNVPVVLQPSSPDQGTVAGSDDQYHGPYFQQHFDNMGH